MLAQTLRRFLTAVVVAAMLGGAPAACADIPIGLAAPLSGEMEYAGEQLQHGAELAIAELNAAGGVLGQQLLLYLADDYCDPEQAVAAARKLMADKIAVVIGHACSGAAIPASEVYEAARIPFLTHATNPLLTERGLRFTFRGSSRAETPAVLAANYILHKLAARRIAIVHDTRTYGKGQAEVTSKRLAELGTPETLFEAVQPGQLVYADLIEQLRRAEIEVVYYAGYSREAGLLRRQMGEAGFLPTMIGSGGISNEDYGLIAGPAAEGTLIIQPRIFETPEYSEFEARFRASYGVKPDLRARASYRDAKIWAQAVAAAGTTDGPAVANALHYGTFHVFGVEAQFDEKGDVQGPLADAGLFVWHNGWPVPLPPDTREEPATKP